MTLTRRQFVHGTGVAGLGLLAGCGQLPWRESPPQRVPRLGFLIAGPLEGGAIVEPFQRGLHEKGWVEGQNVMIEYRAAEGVAERLPELAAELVNAHVDIIVAAPPSAPGQAAKSATRTIPIVLLGYADPVGQGLIASYARPGGNITGLGSGGAGLTGKRLEFLTAVVPGLSRVAVLWNPDEGGQRDTLAAALDAAQALRIELLPAAVRASDELNPVFETLQRDRVEAVFPLGAALFFQYRTSIAALALQHRLPSSFQTRENAEAGGLMAYGANFPDLARRGAVYVDKILRGENPAAIPVEQPMVFDFVINLQTAQALGLTIPQHVLLQATEVIQ